MTKSQIILFSSIMFTGLPGAVLAENVAPDNTAKNARDAHSMEVTAGDQSSREEYIEVTRKIRATLTGNDQLSTYAKNIKIITTDDGKVTLKGPVESDAERQTVLDAAALVVARPRVISQIEVMPEGRAQMR